MHTKEEVLSLANLKGGEVIAKFDKILMNDILPNIQDPNTQPDGAREITIKVQFKPDKDRFITGISAKVWASKLVADDEAEVKSVIDVGLNGEIVIKELLPAQQELAFEKPETTGKVTSISKKL